MKLMNLKLNEYLDILLSDAPAPGGGSVSALAGAQGAALVAMVADLTISKERFAEYHDVCKDIHAKAEELYTKLAAAVDEDTAAYNLIAVAFKMPKGTDEEKAARKKAIADGTLEATKVPFGVLTMGAEGLKLAEQLIDNYNTNCASDLGVGVLNFMACIKGAWLNVKINLPGVKDDAAAAEFEAEGKRLFEESEKIADKLYKRIEESL